MRRVPQPLLFIAAVFIIFLYLSYSSCFVNCMNDRRNESNVLLDLRRNQLMEALKPGLHFLTVPRNRGLSQQGTSRVATFRAWLCNGSA